MPEAPVLKTLWAILHVQSPVAIGYVHYPLIPWVGVMAAGYALGSVFEMEPDRWWWRYIRRAAGLAK